MTIALGGQYGSREHIELGKLAYEKIYGLLKQSGKQYKKELLSISGFLVHRSINSEAGGEIRRKTRESSLSVHKKPNSEHESILTLHSLTQAIDSLRLQTREY